ncbi:unnamed protein product, partial [Polarella glacialis]
ASAGEASASSRPASEETPGSEKKTRGRPRKMPEQLPAEEVKVKVKRGRPPKVEAAEASPARKLNTGSARTSDGSASVELGPDVFGEDPADPRLTAEGAVCDQQFRLVLSSYNDFKSCFAREPPPIRHPDPLWPGLRLEEIPGGERAVSLEGLRNWSDAKGSGWIATGKVGKSNLSRWFSSKVWGSWRLAFLLAKVQREVWTDPSRS